MNEAKEAVIREQRSGAGRAATRTDGERFMWRNLTRTVRELQPSFGEVGGSYRPDLHYLGGPGPKWRAKYGNLAPKTMPTAIAPRAAMRDPRSRLNEKEMCHARNTMILLAIVVLGTMVATHASATGRGATGVYGNGFHNYPPPTGFQGPVITVPAMQPPAFNPSIPYTVPQSPEVPVSPASPGSVFRNH
jgi:hypothetical protein